MQGFNSCLSSYKLKQEYLYYKNSWYSTMPLQYVATTSANSSEKKDQVLKTYVYCMDKLSINMYSLTLGLSVS